MKSSAQINNPWRKTASAIYRRPVDSKILGSVEIDITDLEKYINRKRKEGVKTTFTQFFALAAARAVSAKVPEFNTYVRRGKIVQREHIDVSVSVLLHDGQMSSIVIHDADRLTLSAMIELMNQRVQQSRNGQENRTMRSKNLMAAIPWPFRNWIFKIVKTFTMDWGFSIPAMGLSANSFGSFVVTNIGNVGLELGFPALFPTSNVSIVITLGGIKTKPWVVDGQVVPRSVISIGVAIDHRVADASHGGKLFREIKYYVQNPAFLEDLPA